MKIGKTLKIYDKGRARLRNVQITCFFVFFGLNGLKREEYYPLALQLVVTNVASG